MRIKQEESQFLGTEIGLASDCRKRENVSIGLLLMTVDQMTGGAPALRKFCSMIRVGSHCC